VVTELTGSCSREMAASMQGLVFRLMAAREGFLLRPCRALPQPAAAQQRRRSLGRRGGSGAFSSAGLCSDRAPLQPAVLGCAQLAASIAAATAAVRREAAALQPQRGRDRDSGSWTEVTDPATGACLLWHGSSSSVLFSEGGWQQQQQQQQPGSGRSSARSTGTPRNS
jgi:hypothetical protein